jgi:hypothetical protein
MTIPGYENRELVLAQLAALEREATNPYSESHLEAIKAQVKVFKKALKEIEAEGDPVDEGRRRGRSTLIRNSTTGRTYQEWMN